MGQAIDRDFYNGNVFGVKICDLILPAISAEWQKTQLCGGDGEAFLDGVLESLTQFVYDAFDLDEVEFDEEDDEIEDEDEVDDDEEDDEEE